MTCRVYRITFYKSNTLELIYFGIGNEFTQVVIRMLNSGLQNNINLMS